MQDRFLAQQPEQRSVKADLTCIAQQCDSLGVTECNPMIGRAEHDADRDIAQDHLNPCLLFRDACRFAGHGFGECAAGIRKIGGDGVAGRTEIAEIACRLGVDGALDVAVGAYTQCRRQRLNRLGNVFVEQEPNPGRETDQCKTGKGTGNDEGRRTLRLL